MRPDTTRSQPTVPERRPTMRRALIALMAAAAGTIGACSLDITNPNSPTQAGALTNPRDAATREIVGVFATYRDNRADELRDFGGFRPGVFFMFFPGGPPHTRPPPGLGPEKPVPGGARAGGGGMQTT